MHQIHNIFFSFSVFAAALLVFTFAVKKIQENFWYSHIAYGLIVLLISIAYCCVFHGFIALNIFIILNVALAIAAAVVLIAVNLKRLDLTAFTAVEAVSELCLCFGAMFGLFLLGNTVRCCVGNPHIFCFAMTQAFFFWIFITLLFSAIYLLTLPPKTNADESDQEKPESDSQDTSGQVYHVK
ncbi:unnamed protein product [Trichobilharzia szidati]|nr:unnamed protein product [Trichobilharzia szidati]